jgi:hypothetical protein|tara:strand:+ start:38 stop:163 length:126 start_codon:yes stop_codon:yes gene_type:complete
MTLWGQRKKSFVDKREKCLLKYFVNVLKKTELSPRKEKNGG